MAVIESPESLDRVVEQLQELETVFKAPTPDGLAGALPVLEQALASVASLQRQWAEKPPTAENWPAWRDRLTLVLARLAPLGVLARQGTASFQARLARHTGASYTAGGAPLPEQQLAVASRRWRGDL